MTRSDVRGGGADGQEATERLSRLAGSTGSAGSAGSAGSGSGQPADATSPPSPRRSGPLPPGTARAALLAAAVAVAALIGRGLLSDAGGASEEVIAAGTSSTGQAAVPSVPATGPTTLSDGVLTAAPSPSASTGSVVVHVAGKVRRPGLVTLTADARVADAVDAAGGTTRAAAPGRINLARKAVDGEQILVPGPDDPVPEAMTAGPAGAAGSGPGGSGGSAAGEGALVDLNTATQAQLETLPGIGPVTAERILDWRHQHQRFSRVEELGEVSGIGPKTLERLRPLVKV